MRKVEKKPKSFAYLLGVFVVLLLVAIGGIYLIQSSTTENTSTPSPSTECQYNEDVCLYLSKLKNPKKYYKGPFTASILTSEPNKTPARVIIKSDEKGNYTIISYKGTVFSGETVIVGNTVYKKDMKTNTWVKTTTPPDETILQFKAKSLAEVTKEGNDVKYTFIGTSKCGKKTCMKYQVIAPELGTTKMYVLFTQTNRLLKEVITKNSDNKTTDILFVYSDVTIPDPKK